ncbi:MAG: hypothetical protein AMJ55_00285 [Gammaproteobacteria bacterium SG8_15]|nr:MAG: hypothetical protein AMJ55_00285 [Gammaproteobacteria bacterium SG8_15]
MSTFRVNVKANIESTVRKTVFFDIKPDSMNRIRVVPPVDETGMIFTKAVNHFKLKNEDGFGIALACLEEHGDEGTCYLCKLIKFLEKTGDKSDAKVAKMLAASSRWYLQAFIGEKDVDGNLNYTGPKLVGLSKTTAEKVSNLLTTQDQIGDVFFCDPDNGQDLVVQRIGTGFKTKYEVQLTGKQVALSDIVPDWEDKLITDVNEALNMKVRTPEEQREAVLRTFGDELDWDTIDAAVS